MEINKLINHPALELNIQRCINSTSNPLQTILSKYVEAENSGIGKSDVFGDSQKDKCIENSYLCSPVHPLRGRLLFVSPA